MKDSQHKLRVFFIEYRVANLLKVGNSSLRYLKS